MVATVAYRHGKWVQVLDEVVTISQKFDTPEKYVSKYYSFSWG